MNIVDVISATQEFEEQYRGAENDPDKATAFWNTYNENPHDLLLKHQYDALRERMFTLLRACKKTDPAVYEGIHKGHPYFFIGITSYRLGDYQTAISFFDAALSEDLSIHDEKERPTHLFFLLKGDDPRNAARQDTRYVQTKVERAIGQYKEAIASNEDIPDFDIQDLRDVFVRHVLSHESDLGLRTLLTALMTFVVEWDFRNEHYDLGVKKGTAEPLFTHLFRGCVLFESLLKRNPFPKPEHEDQNGALGKLITYYKSEMNLDLPGDLSSKKSGVTSFEDLLIKIPSLNIEITDSVLVAFWLRNVLGHSLAWNVDLDQDSYRKLYLAVITACIHVINCLWRDSH